MFEQCLFADEVRFVEIYKETQACFERRVSTVHIVTVIAVTFFDAKGVQRLHPGESQTQVFACLTQRIECPWRKFGGNVKLITKLTLIRHPVCHRARIMHIDLAHGHVWEVLIR